MAILEAKALTKRFGGVTALDDLSLSVEEGSVLGIMGPNGAGKSTLLKTLLGEVTPDSGEVWLDGHNVSGWPTYKIAKEGVALANQIPRPFFRLTVAQNVHVGALARGDRLRDVDVLELCGLADKANRPAASLGLLDLKRLEMARALSLHPRILFLDEVGAGLVSHETEQMIDIVRQVHAQGVTLIVVEHVETVIRELAQKVIVIDWGKLIAEGTPGEIAENAQVRAIYLGEGGGTHTSKDAERTSTETPLLEVSGITARYGKATALTDVSLRVLPGEVVSVLGANGAGKTTLTRVITGLIAPVGGTLAVDGLDVTALPPHKRVTQGIASCPEGRRIFAELTVEENLRLGGYILSSTKDRDARLDEMCTLFPILGERRSQLAGTMSGGQQQLLAMARALMSRPRLLILDEASLGLSPVAVDLVYDAIGQIRQSGVSVLLIEQNARRSLGIADFAYVLDRGRITYEGPPASLDDEERLAAAYFGGSRAH